MVVSNTDFTAKDPALAGRQRLDADGLVRRHVVIERGDRVRMSRPPVSGGCGRK